MSTFIFLLLLLAAECTLLTPGHILVRWQLYFSACKASAPGNSTTRSMQRSPALLLSICCSASFRVRFVTPPNSVVRWGKPLTSTALTTGIKLAPPDADRELPTLKNWWGLHDGETHRRSYCQRSEAKKQTAWAQIALRFQMRTSLDDIWR